MTATTLTGTAGRIFAIALGKYKSVACDYDPATAEVAFATFDTTGDELRRRLARGRRHRGVRGLGLGT